MATAEHSLKKVLQARADYRLADLRANGVAECPEAGFVRSRQSLRPWATHTHGDRMEACYLAAGQRVYQRGDRTFFVRGGDLWINPPGLVHGAGVQPAGSSVFYWFYLVPPRNAKPWCGLPADAARKFWKSLVVRSDDICHATPLTRTLFDRLLAAAAAPDAARDVRVRLAFLSLLSDVDGALDHHVHALLHPRIRRLLDRLGDTGPAGRVSIAQLAAAARLSPSYFKKAFRAGMGVTPAQYFLHQRLVAAARRLSSTDAPIAKIAQDLGFASSQYFTTAFHHCFCVTPLAYRQAGVPRPLRLP